MNGTDFSEVFIRSEVGGSGVEKVANNYDLVKGSSAKQKLQNSKG